MEILEKLQSGERLNYEDGVKLWDLDLFDLGKFAFAIRKEKNGKNVYFNANRHINPSNLCADTCKFCAFSAHRKSENAYKMSDDEIMRIVDETVARGTKEIHIVSSHNPFVTPQQYLGIFKAIKQKYPLVHIKAMTAAEIDYWRLKVECPSGETQVMAEIVTPNELRKEDISAFERIRERVQALGGRFSRAFTGKGQLLEFRLPESRTGGVDDATPSEEKKSLGRRIAGIALPLLVLGALAFWTYSTQRLEWPLAWAFFGYLSTAVMYWWPIPGGAMGTVAVAGMLITPEQTPVALSAVILMACWKFTRGRNPYWSLGAGLVALIGLWVLSITRLTDSPELVVGVSMPFIGLVCAAISWQYAKIRNRQDQQAAALMEAIEAARTEERNLLARELHDVLAHHFSVVLLQCMAYGDSDDAEEVRFALDRIAGSLKAAEGELFLLTDVMSDGEKGDLPALVRPLTVADRLQGTLKNAHFQAEFKIDPSSDGLPQITRRTLTRAMQESVTNIIRYAEHGGKCLVELKMEETAVRLRVCNELPENKRESKLSLGYGLAGIQERINLSGGRFTAGPEGNQWVVTVELPNRGREAESLGGPSTYIH